jgi:hypothetical protein
MNKSTLIILLIMTSIIMVAQNIDTTKDSFGNKSSIFDDDAEKLVGEKGMTAVFLLIQHSPLEYQKKYFPQIEKSAYNGDIPLSDVAYLTDKILTKEGKKQLYGTQLKYSHETKSYKLKPIEDEKNMNERRRQVGLGPVEDYAKNFGFEYKSN